MHAVKTLGWAGATPLLTAFSRPTQSGVAPARRAGSVTVFWPRAFRDAIRPITESKQFQIPRGEIQMTVLKAPPKQPKTTVVQLRLDDDAREKLTRYAEFLDSSPSYVVTEALKLVCSKDKQFQAWLSAQHRKTSEPNTKGESFQLELK
jgi:predicted transcriptional regulator